MSNEKNILKALAAFKPQADQAGPIAIELDATPIEMNRLLKEGKVIKAGARSTGKRGRPPVEWALPGTVVAVDEDAPKVDRLAKARAAKAAKAARRVEAEAQAVLDRRAANVRLANDRIPVLVAEYEALLEVQSTVRKDKINSTFDRMDYLQGQIIALSPYQTAN